MIKPLMLSKIAVATSGELIGEDKPIQSVSIDTRSINAGELFVALKGEHFDGHGYVTKAESAGCSAMVVETAQNVACPQVMVTDTREALGKIAGLNRDNFSGKLVGITGSSGKTTAKNMLASILAQAGNAYATKGNFNNEVGVPLTLLALAPEHEYAVVEMGARQVGDIAYLGSFVRPDVAVLLNVGDAHIDVFGSYDNIVSAKSEIFNSVGENGVVVFNADDPAAEKWQEMTAHQNTLRFSASGNEADVWAEVVEYQQDYCRFMLCTTKSGTNNTDRIDITLPMPGHHNVLNSLAAAAAAIAVGLSLVQIKSGLENSANDSGRLHAIDLSNGTRVIDDSYNANPSSMKAALDVLALYEGKTCAVLGEMAELGDFAERLHLQVAEHAKQSKVERVLLVGPYAKQMAEVLGERAQAFDNKQELLKTLQASLTGKETVLIKGSRCAAMDEIVTQLMEATV